MFYWTAALLAMAVIAWCLLGAVLLWYGDSSHRPWPSRPCTNRINTKGTDPDPVCHIQNNGKPLAAALSRGCPSIGVEVWLSENQEVVIGNGPDDLFSTTYVEPLLQLLAEPRASTQQHTSRHSSSSKRRSKSTPGKALVLVLDLVDEHRDLWPRLLDTMEPLRQAGHLTHFDGLNIISGPLTVVANTSFEEIIAEGENRDIFFDAPLELFSAPLRDTVDVLHLEEDSTSRQDSSLGQAPFIRARENTMDGDRPRNPAKYSLANSYFASASFRKAVGQVEQGRLSEEQMSLVRRQVTGAHARGLRVRYFDMPRISEADPEYVRRMLRKQGVDVISV
jgi:hypothetical protein